MSARKQAARHPNHRFLRRRQKFDPGQKGRGTKGSAADSGQRKYLGYIVRVYYDDDLQAVQAEPSRLLQHFPPSKEYPRHDDANYSITCEAVLLASRQR